MERATASDYLALLEAVFLVRELPARGATFADGHRARRRCTSSTRPRCPAPGAQTGPSCPPDPTSLTELGQLLEIFVIGKVLKQVSWLEGIARCCHRRTYGGDEVDLVVEGDDGGVIAFEVKAGSRIRDQDWNRCVTFATPWATSVSPASVSTLLNAVTEPRTASSCCL